MALFTLDPGLAIWTWITFGLLLFLLQRFVFPSLLRTIRNREATIAGAVDNATKIEARLAEIEEERKEIIRRSHAEADEMIRRARDEAAEVRSRLIEQAEQDAEEVIAQAQAAIADERAAAVDALRVQIADFACDTAEQVIGRSFTGADDRAFSRELANTL